MFGGVQAVTWTDVKIMVLIVFGLFAVIAAAVVGFPDGRQPRRRPQHRRRHRPAADVRLQLRPDEPVHVLVRHDRGVLPVLLLLRHRPEPGAALSHGQVRRRSAQLAADERLLEDPAAGRSCCCSACWCSCSTCSTRRRSSSAATADERLKREAARRLCGAAAGARCGDCRREAATDWRAPARGCARRRGACAQSRAADADVQQIRRRARELVRQTTGDAAFDDVNYIIPRFILRAASRRPRRPAHPRHPAGRDRHDRRRAELAVDGDGDRLLPPLGAPGGDRCPLPHGLQGSPPACGVCSRAWSPCGRRSSAR